MEKTTLLVEEKTADVLRRTAEEMGVSMDVLVEKALRTFLRQEAEQKIDREESFFKKQHASLVITHAGKYVAMHEGKVIDEDAEELALYLRIRKSYPTVGILLKQVLPEPEEIWSLRGFTVIASPDNIQSFCKPKCSQISSRWARHSLVLEGFLKMDSLRGMWEISEAGRRHLAEISC